MKTWAGTRLLRNTAAPACTSAGAGAFTQARPAAPLPPAAASPFGALSALPAATAKVQPPVVHLPQAAGSVPGWAPSNDSRRSPLFLPPSDGGALSSSPPLLSLPLLGAGGVFSCGAGAATASSSCGWERWERLQPAATRAQPSAPRRSIVTGLRIGRVPEASRRGGGGPASAGGGDLQPPGIRAGQSRTGGIVSGGEGGCQWPRRDSLGRMEAAATGRGGGNSVFPGMVDWLG